LKRRFRFGKESWPEVAIFCVFALSTLFFWRLLVRQDLTRMEGLVVAHGPSLEQELVTDRLQASVHLLVRAVAAWQEAGGPGQADREALAERPPAASAGQHELVWFDAALTPLWCARSDRACEPAEWGESGASPLRRTLHQARLTHSVRYTPFFTEPTGERAFAILMPVSRGDRLVGVLGAVYELAPLLGGLLRESRTLSGYRITLRDDAGSVFPPSEAGRSGPAQLAASLDIRLPGTHWTAELRPGPAELARMRSPLPLVALLVGLVLSLLFGFSVRLQRLSRLRAHEAEAANERLRIESLARSRAETRLGETRTRLAQLIDASPAMLYVLRVDGEHMVPEWMSPNFAPHLGYDREDTTDRDWWMAHVHPDDRSRVQANRERMLAEGHALQEYRIRRGDGTYVWLRDDVRVVTDVDGARRIVVGSLSDITNRKQAELAVRESEERYRRLFEENLAGVFRSTVEGKLLDCNAAYARVLGFESIAAALACSAWDLYFDPADREVFLQRLLAAGSVTNFEMRMRRKDGAEVWVLENVSLSPSGGEPAASIIQGTLFDNTARKRAEAELERQRLRLEGLSRRLVEAQEGERQRLARELHDEIGQELTALKLLLEMSLRSVPAAPALTLSQGQSLVSELIDRIRDLSLDLRPAMLDDLGLAVALEWLAGRFSAQMGIAVHLEQEGYDVRLPPDLEIHLYRIVQESLTNVARHAQATEATVRLWADPDTLWARVKDDGQGFDLEAMRVAGRSSGLEGMYERAAALGGQLDVRTAVGEGVQVTVRVPRNGA